MHEKCKILNLQMPNLWHKLFTPCAIIWYGTFVKKKWEEQLWLIILQMCGYKPQTPVKLF
jgi:hypothetical protein